MPSRRIPTLDLFSGIGGFSLALRSICKTVGYCEIDSQCQKILTKNMIAGNIDTAPIYEDISKLTATMLHTKPRLITAGFPCQDVSSCNDGPRSGLIWQVFRLLEEIPEVEMVFLENSPFIRYKGLQALVLAFSKVGFTVSYGIFSSKNLGAVHNRDRWYCLAHRRLVHLRLPRKLELYQDWATEPCPRVIYRNTPETYRSCLARNRRLGNSVVPACVYWAFTELNDATSKSQNGDIAIAILQYSTTS